MRESVARRRPSATPRDRSSGLSRVPVRVLRAEKEMGVGMERDLDGGRILDKWPINIGRTFENESNRLNVA